MLLSKEDNLRPNEPITKAEFAEVLSALYDGNNAADITFESGGFSPDNEITRAEMATIMNRLYNRAVDANGLKNIKQTVAKFPDISPDDWYYFEIVEASATHEYGRSGKRTEDKRDLETWTIVYQR